MRAKVMASPHAAPAAPIRDAAPDSQSDARAPGRWRGMWRIGRTMALIVLVECAICAAAVFPAVALCAYAVGAAGDSALGRTVVLAALLAPAYAIFILLLMTLTPAATRVLGWRTPDAARLRIADLETPLLRWACYMAAIHVVRVFAGTLVRGSPVWSAYLRLQGARIGRGVYVNSLAISDYNLLEFGDGVVIGGGAHISGHTVERGVVVTARVTLESRVTVGIGSVIEIGVHIGEGTQVGALSFVPKHTRLEGRALYAGSPVSRL